MKNFGSGLLSLMLFAIMACVGLGQHTSSDCHEQYSSAVSAKNDVDAAKASADGYWSQAYGYRDDADSSAAACLALLNGPQFSTSYNLDPAMPAVKAGFVTRYNALVSQIAAEKTATATDKASYDTLAASAESTTADIINNVLNVWNDRLSTRDYTYFTIYSYDDIYAGLDTAQSLFEFVSASINGAMTTYSSGKATAWLAIKNTADDLLGEIAAY